MKRFQKANISSNLSGDIRAFPGDFRVDEIQVFTPSGQGEHVWLQLKKEGENTDWVAGLLAKIAKVPRKDVSYAGMKDRHAITTQWFSVQLPGRDAPNWQEGLPDSVQVLTEKRHDRKLRRGTLEGNQFCLIIRNFSGDESELDACIKRISEQGIPNYFGEQRFGHMIAEGVYQNIQKSQQWFKGEFKVKSRPKRSIYLSATRSWIFNHGLSERVKNGTWNLPLEGDVFMLEGSKSCFTDALDQEIIDRVSRQEIHPTGVLWGAGDLMSTGQVEEMEQSIGNSFDVLSKGLESKGLKQERKSLRLTVKELKYTMIDEKTVKLSFRLPAGAFATSVLSEIGQFSRKSHD